MTLGERGPGPTRATVLHSSRDAVSRDAGTRGRHDGQVDRRRLVSTAVAVVAMGLALLGMGIWAGGDRTGGDWQWMLAVALVYAPAGVALVRRSSRLSVVFLTMAVSAGVSLLAGEHAAAVAEG